MSIAAVLLVVALNDGFRYLSPAGSDSQPVVQQGAAQEPISPPAPSVPLVSNDVVSEPDVATIVSEQPKEDMEKDETAFVRVLAEAENRVDTAAAVVEESGKEVVLAQMPPKPIAIRKTDTLNAAEKGNSPRTKARPIATAAASSKVAAKGNGRDKDVDLIAALLSHVSSSSKASVGEGMKERMNASNTARALSAGGAPKRERKTVSNRDVVTQASGESTESLVARCRALGFIEGELCRVRVCFGLWGKDPACPSNDPTPSS